MTKALVDFSGCLLLRLPDELGGAYFLFTMVTTQVSIPVSVYVYNKYFEADEVKGEEKMDATLLWIFAIVSIIMTAVSFLIFMVFLCDPKFRWTFCSTRTGWRESCGPFLDFEDDEHRILIFGKNRMQWNYIAADVKAWSMANWEEWERDKPEWFTPYVKSTVPDEFIPPRFLAAMGGNRERRGSALIHVGDALATARKE